MFRTCERPVNRAPLRRGTGERDFHLKVPFLSYLGSKGYEGVITAEMAGKCRRNSGLHHSPGHRRLFQLILTTRTLHASRCPLLHDTAGIATATSTHVHGEQMSFGTTDRTLFTRGTAVLVSALTAGAVLATITT